MRYLITIHEHDDEFARQNDPEQAAAYWETWRAYFENEVEAADPNHVGVALQSPETATTIRGSTVEDGPFIKTVQPIGGFFIVDVDNLDDALSLAAKCPACANGGVEVRPILSLEEH